MEESARIIRRRHREPTGIAKWRLFQHTEQRSGACSARRGHQSARAEAALEQYGLPPVEVFVSLESEVPFWRVYSAVNLTPEERRRVTGSGIEGKSKEVRS